MTTRLPARAILFDMDGTLVDSTAIVEMVWGRFADEHDISIEELLSTSHGVKAIDTIRRYTPNIDADVAARALADFEITQTEGIIEIPGAAAFTAAIPDGRFALVTSAPRDLAVLRLELCGIRLPEVVVAAESVSNGKPHPEPYLTAAAALGLEPDDVVVFEDAAAGIHSGLAAGMRVVVVGELADDIAEGLPRLADYREASIEATEHGFDILL